MTGIGVADMVSAGLAVALAALALLGYRINQRCKDRRVWWSHIDGFLTQRHERAFSTPASNVGLGLFSAALVALFAVFLKTALRHNVAGSFIFLTLWLPLMTGLLMVVLLPVVLLARWGARVVAGLKQAF